jgi:hypothetical protein
VRREERTAREKNSTPDTLVQGACQTRSVKGYQDQTIKTTSKEIADKFLELQKEIDYQFTTISMSTSDRGHK